jgi:hypothetical protein
LLDACRIDGHETGTTRSFQIAVYALLFGGHAQNGENCAASWYFLCRP